VPTDKLIRVVRVVAVSPGDVQAERQKLQAVVDELNREIAPSRGCRLDLWRWETDASPGLHLLGPQGKIDELMQIEAADIVVGIFWKRFGTPTHESGSGTEHELRNAWAAWKDHGRPDVMVYFCTRAYAPQAPDEVAQWQRVLEFQRELPEAQLGWRYRSVGDFEALVRKHLTSFILARITAPEPPAASAMSSRLRFNLPVVAASFRGRERELASLGDAVRGSERVVVTQAITGLGGVGKSQLAAAYAHRNTEAFDITAWIRAEDGGISDLAELAFKLGEPVEGRSPQERAALAIEALSRSEASWLLVLDNLQSPEHLASCCPRSGHGRVLITSRDRAMSQFGPMLSVDVFDEETATGYLVERAGRVGDEPAARGAVACGGVLRCRHELRGVPRAARRPSGEPAVRQLPRGFLRPDRRIDMEDFDCRRCGRSATGGWCSRYRGASRRGCDSQVAVHGADRP
jgi:hypothetical protein